MIKAKCISKNRDNKGTILNYTLQDQNGQRINVTGQQIKQAMQNGQIDVINLQIDKAGRLIDKVIQSKEKQLGTDKMLTEAKKKFNSEINYFGGTGAFQFTVREFKKYTLNFDELIQVIPEDFQRELHTALIYFIYESTYGYGDSRRAFNYLTQHEGEIAGKLAVYLLKKYGDHLEEYKCRSILGKDYEEHTILKYAVYKRDPIAGPTESAEPARSAEPTKSAGSANWINLLDALRQNRFSYGGIDIFYGNAEKTKSIQSLDDIKASIDKTLYMYDYDAVDNKSNINVFIRTFSENKQFKENMFKLIADYKQLLDSNGITAEVYSNHNKGFIKLYMD